LNKVTKSYQEVTAHLSQATQENSQLSSRVQSLEHELSLVDQSKMQQLENELKQKVKFFFFLSFFLPFFLPSFFFFKTKTTKIKLFFFFQIIE